MNCEFRDHRICINCGYDLGRRYDKPPIRKCGTVSSIDLNRLDKLIERCPHRGAVIEMAEFKCSGPQAIYDCGRFGRATRYRTDLGAQSCNRCPVIQSELGLDDYDSRADKIHQRPEDNRVQN